MLKFVIIGVLVIGILSFIVWNLWKMTRLKHKYFSDSEDTLHSIEQFEDVPDQLMAIRNDRVKNMLIGLGGAVFAILLVFGYFFTTRIIFLNNHEHRYDETVIKKPICIEEGILQYRCSYCDNAYEEPIAVIEHDYTESARQEPTCTQEGKQEYTCNMCKDVKTEPIPIVSHQYVEAIEKEATCAVEGVLARQCEVCSFVEKEVIPVTDEHQYALSSFAPSTFWKNGYNRYSCVACGSGQFSLRAETFNWIVVLAMIVFAIALSIIIYIRVDEGFWDDTLERPWFWISLVCALVAVGVMIFHWGSVIPHQKECKPVYQEMTEAPTDCELVEVQRVASLYTEHGTVTYQCQKCNREYVENLPLKEIDMAQIPIYAAPVIAERNEVERNGTFDRATEIPINTRVTGRLPSREDIDCYKVTLAVAGNLKFHFTSDGGQYSSHWVATIYSTDASTVLSEGYIDKEEFGYSDLPAGTYYLKISPISGGNPISNTFSDANYYLRFTPECTVHASKSQYFSVVPTCENTMEITTVCNQCGTVVSVENDQKLEHRWGEWQITKPSTALSVGEKVRTCVLCNETDIAKDLTYWWVFVLAIAEISVLIVCLVRLFNKEDNNIVCILLLMGLSAACSIAIVKNPVFATKLGNEITLGLTLALNLTLLIVLISQFAQEIASSVIYTYQVAPFVFGILFAIVLILHFTFLAQYVIASIIVMLTLVINSIVYMFIAISDYDNFWMGVNLGIVLVGVILTGYFWFTI